MPAIVQALRRPEERVGRRRIEVLDPRRHRTRSAPGEAERNQQRREREESAQQAILGWSGAPPRCTASGTRRRDAQDSKGVLLGDGVVIFLNRPQAPCTRANTAVVHDNLPLAVIESEQLHQPGRVGNALTECIACSV
jgi:hypothetical protein